MVIKVAVGGGELLEVSDARVATSGVLALLAECNDSAPAAVPFGAEAVRIWASGAPETVHTFHQATEVLKVADFLEAPTTAWALRACRLGLGPRRTAAALVAARALFAAQTHHVRRLLEPLQLVVDPRAPLQAALQAPQELHAHAIAARLGNGCSGSTPGATGTRALHDLLALHGGHTSAVPGLHILAGGGGGGALAAPQLVAAMRALRDVAQCEWLSVHGGHGAECDTVADAITDVLLARGGVLRLRGLTIAAVALSDEQAAGLAGALAIQTQLRRLALKHCEAASAATAILLDTAAELPSLTTLELHGMLGGRAAEAAVLVARLQQFKRLTTLRLRSANILQTVPPETVAAAFASLTALRELAVTGTTLCQPVEPILIAVEYMTSLESFTWEVLSLDAATDNVWAPLVRGTSGSLTRLSLGRQRLTHDAAAGLQCLAGLTRLQHLDVVGVGGSTSLAPSSARALAHALAAMKGLTRLNIGGVRACTTCTRVLTPAIGRLLSLQEFGLQDALALDSQHAELALVAIAAGLDEFCSGLTALRTLDLGRTLLDDAGSVALVPWLGRLSSLAAVSMRRCKQSAASAAELCGALTRATFLDLAHQLPVDSVAHAMGAPASLCSLGADLHALGAALSKFRRLRVLDLSGNGLDAAGMQAMGSAWAGLSELKRLDVARNALNAEALSVVGAHAARMPNLESLNVSHQRTFLRVGGWKSGHWALDAASVAALAQALRCRATSAPLLVLAHGCKGSSEAERAVAHANDEVCWVISSAAPCDDMQG